MVLQSKWYINTIISVNYVVISLSTINLVGIDLPLLKPNNRYVLIGNIVYCVLCNIVLDIYKKKLYTIK